MPPTILAPPGDNAGLLDTADVARRFKVTPETVRDLVASGQLAAHKVGSHYRYRPEDVDAYLAAVRHKVQRGWRDR